MNKSRMTAFTTAIMLCLAATVMAQPPGGGRGGQGRGGPGGQRGGPGGDAGRMLQMMPVLAALDADKDGVLSKAEIANASVALGKLDKNGDGELNAEEMRPQRPEGGRTQGRGRPEGERPERGGRAGGSGDMVQRMMAMDKNEDGKISEEEAPERMKAMFGRVDSNGDGFIDKSEIEAMAERVGGGRGGPGQRGGAGRRGNGGNDGGQKPKRPATDKDN